MLTATALMERINSMPTSARGRLMPDWIRLDVLKKSLSEFSSKAIDEALAALESRGEALIFEEFGQTRGEAFVVIRKPLWVDQWPAEDSASGGDHV